ncbi:MAG: EamA family transporter RarD [bacterium]|nr:EamA family transporter RarD [bacterium]
MSDQPSIETALSPSGMLFATACYLCWGIVPIYWKEIPGIPAEEVLIPRILWTLVLLLIVSRARGQMADTWAARGRAWGWTLIAAFLLAGNWCLFIYAVQADRVLATSLGYYINPLMSILLGLLILGERLNLTQAIAVAIAALGVATLAIREGHLPWISLALATTFALYGLIHKIHPQPSLAGLTREMLVLAPATLGVLAFLSTRPSSALVDASLADHAFLSLSAIVTAGPLLLFHAATRRLPLVAVGMFQYIAPTITLVLAISIYGEAFTPAHATGFGLVWAGLVLFTLDSVRRAGAKRLSRRSKFDRP